MNNFASSEFLFIYLKKLYRQRHKDKKIITVCKLLPKLLVKLKLVLKKKHFRYFCCVVSHVYVLCYFNMYFEYLPLCQNWFVQ